MVKQVSDALWEGQAKDPPALERLLEDLLGQIVPHKVFEEVSLDESYDRVLAEQIIAPANVPARANSAMDGYALAAGDLETLASDGLEVVGESLAGHPYLGAPLSRGQCIRIFTGAVVPEEADTVVIQENIERMAGKVRLKNGLSSRGGANVRLPGEDIAAGSKILSVGRRLGIADVGLLASLGVAKVRVYRRLCVALMTTGDELRRVGETLGEGDLYDSNRYTLRRLVARDGHELLDLGIVRDQRGAIERAFREAGEHADALISTAGVSVGDTDLVPGMVAEHGEITQRGFPIKPGHPLVVGHVGKAWFFGLAGNPVSSMINYLVVVRPALLRLAGAVDWNSRRYQVELGENVRANRKRDEFRRAVLREDTDGTQRVYGCGPQGSGILSSMSRAECLMRIPRGAGELSPGTRIWIYPLGE